MKKILFAVLAVLCFSSTITVAQNTVSNTKTPKNENSSLSGAWQSVDNKEFLIMNDGFFSSVAQDSTGKWTEFHAGSYTVGNPNTATLKVTHSSFAYRIGYLHTIEYGLKEGNLTLKFYKKMIDPKAGDITDRMHKGLQMQYVRAKP